MKTLSCHQRWKVYCADLLFTYKLVFGTINLLTTFWFFIPNFHSAGRRHWYHLYLL